MRILIVDDNTASAKILGWAAEMFGHDVRLACNGFEALDMARRFRPEVLLLDIHMPGMDGYDVCWRMKQENALKNALFVAQTGWAAACRSTAKEAGFDHYLVKPVNIEMLQALLASAAPAIMQENAA